jgi:nicotinamidase-related amidase
MSGASGSRPVLLLMDFQHGIVERAGSPSVIDAADRAAKAARTAGIPVMFVRVAFRPGYPEVAESNASFSAVAAQAGDAYTHDHPATQVHASLAPLDGDPVIVKRRVSAFSGSDLDVLLRGAGADTLILAGIATGGVVLSTLRQAADLDYRLTVLQDACADPDEEVHRVLTEKVFPRQALVTTTDEWIASL